MIDSQTMNPQTATLSMSLASAGVLIGSLFAAVYGRRFINLKNSLKVFGFLFSGVQLLFVVSVCFSWGNGFKHAILLILGSFMGLINVLCISFVHKIVDKNKVGAVIGTINTIVFCSVLASQWISGMIIDNVSSPNGYFIVFSIFTFLTFSAGIVLKVE